MNYGRKRIYSNEIQVTSANLISILTKSYAVHASNRNDIECLYNYYRGKHSIVGKKRQYNDVINNKVTINLPYKVVSYKCGNILGDPIQYIRRGDNVDASDLDLFNDAMEFKGKAELDRDLAESMLICGVGYYLCLPSTNSEDIFDLYVLNPKTTFVVYSNTLGEKPLMGVTYVENDNKEKIYSIYTEDMFYTVKGDKIVEAIPNRIGAIPIIEYDNNSARLGSFEVGLSIIDAINNLESNRVDDIEQFVNSLLLMKNVEEPSDEQLESIKQNGVLAVGADADAKYLTSTLDESNVQTIVDDLYQYFLSIVGLPNRGQSDGGSSDNGVAVYYREGYQDSETQAQVFEHQWKRSDRELLKLALMYYRVYNSGSTLSVKDIEIKFARRYRDNILTKVQSLQSMLDCGIAPNVAIITSGIWSDGYSVYKESEASLNARWSTETDYVEDRESETQEVTKSSVE